MTNALPQGASGAPPLSYSTAPSTGVMPRRSSYASVAAGNASASSHNQATSVRSGAFSHLMNPNPPPPTLLNYAQSQQLDNNSRGSTQMADSANMVSNIPTSWGKSGTLPSYSTRYPFPDHYGLAGRTGSPSGGFFKPSYLRESKYMEKLELAHKAKLAAQREAASTHSSNPSSLSTSSSSVSLHRMAPSHRGMTYDIVEHQPVIDDDGVTPLPSKWADVDRFGGLEVGSDGLDARYVGLSKTQDHEAAATRTDNPMPPACGIYYYEVTVLQKGKDGLIGIGFSTKKASLERLTGWEQESWAYHGDDGKSFCGGSTGKSYGPTFSTGDIIGCGVNFMTGCGFFTKNGVFQENAFRDLKDLTLYPSVGMKRPGAHIRVNFGQMPFVYDIDGMMTAARLSVREEINKADVTTLQPPLNENALIKELVAQFLAHDGYVETAKAFAEDLNSEARALKNDSENVIENLEIEEDLDAVNRQQIRAAILDGDIDRALKRTNAYYPHVLQENQQIYFRLRCRKFVEMIRACNELRNGTSEKRNKSMNGHSEDVFEPAMELDDPVPNGDDWDSMETEEDNGSKYESMLSETLRYGQALQYEFRDERSKEIKEALTDIFAMFAYEDPEKSVMAPLLDQNGRVPVAEELNSAILVSLGKSSSAAVELLYQQTDVLVNDISENGGPGAFVNVGNDFLK